LFSISRFFIFSGEKWASFSTGENLAQSRRKLDGIEMDQSKGSHFLFTENKISQRTPGHKNKTTTHTTITTSQQTTPTSMALHD
jgi:hypothetical protein